MHFRGTLYANISPVIEAEIEVNVGAEDNDKDVCTFSIMHS